VPKPWGCLLPLELLEIDSLRFCRITVLDPQPKTRAERAFHLGGAGAPAHASCGTKPIFNFSQRPICSGGMFFVLEISREDRQLWSCLHRARNEVAVGLLSEVVACLSICPSPAALTDILVFAAAAFALEIARVAQFGKDG
jgi:hypothetical protein